MNNDLYSILKYSYAIDCYLIREYIRIFNYKIIFSEEHYFNILCSMRIYRMDIPLYFTYDYFLSLFEKNRYDNCKAIFLAINNNNKICFKIFFIKSINKINNLFIKDYNYKVEIYRDFKINTSFFSTLNIPHPEFNIAKVYTKENDLNDLIFLNHNKKICRSLFGNIFLIFYPNKIVVPDDNDGPLISILKNQIINFLNTYDNIMIEKSSLDIYDIYKADELFISVDGEGFYLLNNIGKKKFNFNISEEIYKSFIDYNFKLLI